VLDLGCNAGKLSIESLVHLGAKRVVGLDIDPVLIAQAEAARTAAGLADDDRIKFVEADFLPPGYFDSPPAQQLLPPGERFDTILLLSITKWLHLHAGDTGLLALFHSLAALLAPGGALVVEPQEWANYKAAVKKAKNLKPTFQGIRMRPDFEPYIGTEGGECGQGAGLVLERKIEREEGGFSRPLCVWRKEA
jgi:7SK snRNA methylphosphate capping enzyme